MFGSRFISLILAFCLGVSVCLGAISFGVMAFVANFRVRDLEKHNIMELPDEAFMGDNYEVDLLDLSLAGFYKEFGELKAMGDELTINRLQERYDLKIHPYIDALLSDETRAMPISKLFGQEGIHKILSSVYIGNVENYECHAIDSSEPGDPSLGKEGARWYDPEGGEYITGIAETIAFFNLEDFASGGIHVDAVLEDIVLADVLGYRYEESETGSKIWYDSNGAKVTGIMAVFADCSLDNVDEKINTAHIGDLIGYECDENGVWYETNEEGELVPVSGFMSKIASSSISGAENGIGDVFSSLEIGDIVDEEERNKGIFSIIPANTPINDIDSVVNSSIEDSPMQFFINQGMMTFDASQQESLDDLCIVKGEVKVFKADDADFIKYYKDVANWATDGEGNYIVPAWRNQPLSTAFSYIVGLLLPTT